MLFEPFDQIFRVSGRPQRGSTFPLAAILEADVLLWQEFRFDPATLAWDDLLSLAVGEQIEVRVPHRGNVGHRNEAPLFYTALAPIAPAGAHVTARDAVMMQRAMDERFLVRSWRRELPMAERRPDFPRCGKCCARFYAETGAAPPVPAPPPAPAGPADGGGLHYL